MQRKYVDVMPPFVPAVFIIETGFRTGADG
jgi:hypothetical protein